MPSHTPSAHCVAARYATSLSPTRAALDLYALTTATCFRSFAETPRAKTRSIAARTAQPATDCLATRLFCRPLVNCVAVKNVTNYIYARPCTRAHYAHIRARNEFNSSGSSSQSSSGTQTLGTRAWNDPGGVHATNAYACCLISLSSTRTCSGKKRPIREQKSRAS